MYRYLIDGNSCCDFHERMYNAAVMRMLKHTKNAWHHVQAHISCSTEAAKIFPCNSLIMTDSIVYRPTFEELNSNRNDSQQLLTSVCRLSRTALQQSLNLVVNSTAVYLPIT